MRHLSQVHVGRAIASVCGRFGQTHSPAARPARPVGRRRSRARMFCSLMAVQAALAAGTDPAFAGVTATGDVDPADPLTWTDTTDAYVGKTGEGSVAVDGGSEILSRNGYLGLQAGSMGAATVDGPGSSWDIGNFLYVGHDGEGSLSITNGGAVSNITGQIGFGTDSTGAVTVDGSGSTWTNTGNMFVGHSGAGTLTISNGGQVSNRLTRIGNDSTSTGTVIVRGIDSRWTHSRDLYVGWSGSGTLSILDGGLVSVEDDTYVAWNAGSSGLIHFDNGTLATRSLFSRPEHLVGSGTIHAEGIVSDVELHFDAATGAQQSFVINDQVSVNLDLNGLGVLGIGYRASGTMAIADGLVIESLNGYLGYESGSSGTVIVEGNGSLWRIGNLLSIGRIGEGELTIADGGLVENRLGYIGDALDTSGTVLVTGPGSKWINSQDFLVGRAGTGTLSITNGGLMVTGHHAGIGVFSAASGLVTVAGESSTWTIGRTLEVGGSGEGTLSVIDGGTVDGDSATIGTWSSSTGSVTVDGVGSAWRNNGHLIVARLGSGTLSVTNGGSVTSTFSTIAFGNNVTGLVTVDGVGSTWTIDGDLLLGDAGAGVMSIINGGLVSVAGETLVGRQSGSSGSINFDNGTLVTRSLFTATEDLTGTGTVVANGLVSDIDLTFDTVSGLPVSFVINDQVTVNLDADGTGAVGLGYRASGTMTISNGVVINSSEGYLGYDAASSGTATVDGVGSTWDIGNTVYVGRDGDGSLSITDGGTVSSGGTAYLGWASGSTGTVTVDGPGSSWTNNHGLLWVGREGDGALTITNGGAVHGERAIISGSTDSTGSATVDGAGSIWNLSGALQVGPYSSQSGSASMLVTNGGTILSSGGTIRSAPNSSSHVIIQGPGSSWSNDGPFGVGTQYSLDTEDTLSILDGGAFSAQRLLIGDAGSSTCRGSVVVEGLSSSLTVASDLSVGASDRSIGKLLIDNGASVVSGWGGIGVGTTAQGAVTVSGLGSSWSASSHVIGRRGNGTLNISSGGVVTSYEAEIGRDDGASGVVTVEGAGSRWTISGDLHVGRSDLHVGRTGSGMLTISDGGLVDVERNTRVAPSSSSIHFDNGTLNTTGLWAVAASLTGKGVINTNHIVSDVDLYFDASTGTQQTFIINDQVTVNLNLDGLGTLGLGYQAGGSMVISEGVSVSSSEGYLAFETGSTGTATVDGPGSTWTNSDDLIIGRRGVGALTITNGGAVSSGLLYVGTGGEGTMSVTHGGSVISVGGFIGNGNNASGSVTVDGAGSSWTVDSRGSSQLHRGWLYVGRGTDATAALAITNGGFVSSEHGGIGLRPTSGFVPLGATAITTVDGSGSTWANAGVLRIGRDGDGTLLITNGGTVTTREAQIGRGRGQGTVAVDGPGSNFISSEDITVGQLGGTGTLLITNGGAVTSANGFVATSTNASGTVTVDGAGSIWTIGGRLLLGSHGLGAMSIKNDGMVSASSVDVSYHTASSGTLHFNHGTLTTRDLFVTPADLTGTGMIHTNGLVSDVDLMVDSTRGPQQSFIIKDNVTVNLDLDGSGKLGIGYRASGTMAIADGMVVAATDGFLGYHTGSTGDATVAGIGSTWANSGDLYVGRGGEGSLSITDSGTVSNTAGHIAWGKASTGMVTVDGPGSIWDIGNVLYVGHDGEGSLSITDAGTVSSNGNAYLGRASGSTGTVTVDGPGSSWTTNELRVGFWGFGTLTITNGGLVTSQSAVIGPAFRSAASVGEVTVEGSGSMWTNSGSLRVGSAGTGTLSVLDGGLVSSESSIIASENNATALVDGVDSRWTNSAELIIGGAWTGTGTLSVTNGGLVTSHDGILGLGSSGTGMVTIDGVDSTWSLEGDLVVGDAGTGELSIINGGLVSVAGETFVGRQPGSSGSIHFDNGTLATRSLFAAPEDVTGTGTIIAKGFMSDFDLTFDAAHGPQASFVINDQVTVNLDADGTGSLGVGFQASAALTIADGVSVGFREVYLGYHPEATGTGTISGPGSTLTNSEALYVGLYGVGSLAIRDQATVSNSSGHLGHYAGSTGTVTVEGAGAGWTNSAELIIGGAGTGGLSITQGGSVVSTGGSIGDEIDSTGSVAVDGAGSGWTNSLDLWVGRRGEGTLSITAGAMVGNRTGHIGRNSGSSGAVMVDGADSMWSNSDNLTVGNEGAGVLSITSGGSVDNAIGYVGFFPTGYGQVDVVGSQSTWTNRSSLFVGLYGDGELLISEGGSVSNTAGNIGSYDGSKGRVRVEGSGSTWSSSGNLNVGFFADGTLQISNGGLVSGGALIHIGFSPDSTGLVVVTDADSSLIAAGTLFVGNEGSGALRITNGGLVSSSLTIIGDGRPPNPFGGGGSAGSGTVTVDGVGSVWVNSGDLYVGRQGDGILSIKNGGLVQVDGRLYIDRFGRGGSDYITLERGGMLSLAGDGATDLVAFLNLVQGTDDIRYWNGSEWANIVQAQAGIDFALSYDGTYTTLTVMAIPEPASVVLLGVGGLALIRRKRHAA